MASLRKSLPYGKETSAVGPPDVVIGEFGVAVLHRSRQRSC